MSRPGYKSVVVYVLYVACIQTPASILYDPKRSRPDGACEACRVGRCGVHYTIRQD
jgi:hypothetical protein